MENYVPPFSITDEMLELVSEIMEKIGQLSRVSDLSKLPRLRRINRIKSIHSSLAIEHNSLSLEQVSAIINGKRVLGAPNEIEEVKNAIDAYNLLDTLDPYSVADLLRAHKAMTIGTVHKAGKFRSGEEGVFAGEKCIHLAPPPNMVAELIQNLFDWMREAKTHPLIKSCVFHYEFEFIHPFSDGNGRIGRFWQTVILSQWKQIFAWLPVETMIVEKQEEYYKAISLSTSKGTSNLFIIFMLETFRDTIIELSCESENHINHIDDKLRALLGVMQDYPMTTVELMSLLGLKSRDSFRKNYLLPALEFGLIEMTIPDKPTSGNQKYYKK